MVLMAVEAPGMIDLEVEARRGNFRVEAGFT